MSALPLHSELQATIPLIEASPSLALTALLSIDERISRGALFSPNETLADVSTASLPLLSARFHIAKAYVSLPIVSPRERLHNLTRARDYHHSFLDAVVDLDTEMPKDPRHPGAREGREERVARHRRRRDLQRRVELLERRLAREEDEELERSVRVLELRDRTEECAEELRHIDREATLLEHSADSERDKEDRDRHRGRCEEGREKEVGKGMEVTRITQNPVTGELVVQREHLKQQVFRPGWNLPTMSLSELGDKERMEAIEREATSKEHEEGAKLKPRRYDSLLKDGLEDDEDLVEQSFKLDRAWDQYKEENPRGIGNKLSERGDRNF